MQSTLTLPSGTHIGEYELLELIGRGGFGAVYRARDSAGGWVALKLIWPDSASQESEAQRVRQRVEREIKALSRVRSSAIVQLYRWGVHDGFFWLAMEYLEGQTLAQMLQSGPLAPGRAVQLALQILEGLAVAHDAGIVHRDLKPENIIVQPRRLGGEDAKILDFGVARLQRRSLETFETSDGDKVFGTPAYMAPEQGRGMVSPATDLYAVGTMLHEMLVGVRPYHEGTALETMLAKMRDPLPPYLRHARLPPGLVQAIESALARQPDHRPESAAEMYRSLAPFAHLTDAPLPISVPLAIPVGGLDPLGGRSGPVPTTSHLRGELAEVDITEQAPTTRRPWGLIALIGVVAIGLGITAALMLVDDPPSTLPAARPVILPGAQMGAQPVQPEKVVASPATASPATAAPVIEFEAPITVSAPTSEAPVSQAPVSEVPVAAPVTQAPKRVRRKRLPKKRTRPAATQPPPKKRTSITDF